MNVNELFEKQTENGEKKESVAVVFNRDKDSTEFIKFQFTEDFDEMMANVTVSHWVNNVGAVECNMKALAGQDGKLFLYNGWKKNKDTGVKENVKPEYNCVFCDETYAHMDAEKARATNPAEEKSLAIEAKKLHNRTQTVKTPVHYQVMTKKKGAKKPEVVKELTEGVLSIRLNDLFSAKGVGQYTTLKNFNDLKGTLKDHWFVMNAQGQITPDDSIKDEERIEELNIDIEALRAKVKTYKVGFAEYQKIKGEVDKAVSADTVSEEEIPF